MQNKPAGDLQLPLLAGKHSGSTSHNPIWSKFIFGNNSTDNQLVFLWNIEMSGKIEGMFWPQSTPTWE